MLKTQFLLNAMDVIMAIKGVEDRRIKNGGRQLNFSTYFKASNFSYIPVKINEAVHCVAKFNFKNAKSFECVGSLFFFIVLLGDVCSALFFLLK